MSAIGTPQLPTRIVAVDGHPLFADGLRRLLDSVPDLDLVHVASTGIGALAAVEQHHPDVVLMDLHLPEISGIKAARQITQQRPSVAVLVLSMLDDDDSVFAALRAGARGYLAKGAQPAVSPRDPLPSAVSSNSTIARQTFAAKTVRMLPTGCWPRPARRRRPARLQAPGGDRPRRNRRARSAVLARRRIRDTGRAGRCPRGRRGRDPGRDRLRVLRRVGMDGQLRTAALAAARAGRVTVRTDPGASPTGYPFKILDLPRTLSEQAVYDQRPRTCDLGSSAKPTNGPTDGSATATPPNPSRTNWPRASISPTPTSAGACATH